MAKSRAAPAPYVQPYKYPSPNIPMSAIRRFARQIGEHFQPEKVILFGSYAYGTPHAESDVDLLVIMPARNTTAQANRIRQALEGPFATHLIVRTPQQIERGFREDDWFLREIVGQGKILYGDRNKSWSAGTTPHARSLRRDGTHMKRQTQVWVQKAEEDMGGARNAAAHRPPLRNVAAFHCQQAAEKYLKALLQEVGAAVPRTHDLGDLLDLLLPHYDTLRGLRRSVKSLIRYAVEYRYPGKSATTREMEAALRNAERVRAEVRARLGLAS